MHLSVKFFQPVYRKADGESKGWPKFFLAVFNKNRTTMSSAQENTAVEQDKNRPKDPVPYMNTLTQCTNKMTKEGFVDSFKVTSKGLVNQRTEETYKPEQVSIINFYRFEGQSDPADNTILYVIETSDGGKGTLIDAYGPYSDAAVNSFMQAVEDIQKKVVKQDTAT